MHDFETVRGVDHMEPRMMPSGEQGRTRRRADGADMEMLEFNAMCSESVDRGRGELCIAMATQITPAHVVGEYEEDVRL